MWSAMRRAPRLARSFLSSVSARCSSTESPAEGVPYKKHEFEESAADRSLPSSADVVIVGGGCVGCSTLYHLTKLGVTNVVLVEKDELTAGTTWHTAGLLWRLRPSDLDIELIAHGRNVIKQLEAETDISPGWVENGGLFVASTKERLDEYKRLMTIGKPFGIESHVLSPEETKKLYPLMNVDDITGTLYSPGDGTIEPAGYCSALTRAATRAGAQVFTKCSVEDVHVKDDDFGTKRVTAVETSRGTIRTNCVVNCSGVWAPYLGQMAGVNVPLVAMKHAYVVSERIEGIQNMPNLRDHDQSVYLKLQGDSLCIGGYEPNPIFWDEVKKDFAFSLFELDWDVFGFNIEGHMKRVPAIETAGIKSTVCGPESFTADHKPLMGESPEVRGFYLGCGFNSSGMMLSGGCGNELAKWIVHGKPELDMFSYNIRRFASKLTDNQQWVKERSHEAYAKNYSIVFPHDEPLACRNMSKGALHQTLLDAGCVYQERQGWERPGWFTPNQTAPLLDYDFYGNYGHAAHENYTYNNLLRKDYTFDFPEHHDIIKSNCLACRNHAAIFDMSYFGKYYIVGPDAKKACDWIFSNDINKPAGSTVYTCMLNKRGGVESDLTVSIVEPGSGGPHAPKFEGAGFYVAAGGGSAQYSYSHIADIIQDQKWKCQILDHSDHMALISVQGPNSRAILQALTDCDLSNEAFPFSTHQVINLAGHELRALRLSFVGELGWELHVPNENAIAVYEAVMAEGSKHGLVNAGYRAIESLSIEKGYRHWHGDIRADDTPLEGGLAFTCKLKTDILFLGREAIEKQKAEGLRRRIACFTIDDHKPLHGLEAIWRNGEAVGFLRAADFAFSLNKSIGYGYVRCPEGGVVDMKFLKSGEYHIESKGELIPAQIHTKTPFDPQNKRVKGIYD